MSLSEGAPARSGSGAESGYPENAAAPAQHPSEERRYRPKWHQGARSEARAGAL